MDEQPPQINFQSNGEEFSFPDVMTPKIYALESALITAVFKYATTLERQIPQLLAEGKMHELHTLTLLNQSVSMQPEQPATELLNGRKLTCKSNIPEGIYQIRSWVIDAEQKSQQSAYTNQLQPAPIWASRILCRRSFKKPSLDNTRTDPERP